MRRWLLILLLVLLPPAVAAEVAIPPLTAHVTDLTGTLNSGQLSALETRLQAYETQKGSQIAVLLIPTTAPETIEQYSIRVVEQWKLGRKKVDDGVLLLVAKDDRTLRIEVGYGLEGVLPDAIARRIIAEDITPYFKQGDFYGGLDAGISRIMAVIAGEPLPAPRQESGDIQSYEILFPALFFGTLIGGSFLRQLLGDLPGALSTGGLIGLIVFLVGAGLLFALLAGFVAFFITLGGQGQRFGSRHHGGFGGGFGGGGGGGGFGGGGGGFGGGGASGRW